MKGELTPHKRAKTTASATVSVSGSTEPASIGTKARRKSSSVAEHVRQMAVASTEALQRPRKERERFRRFIVDLVTQGECVPGGHKKAPSDAAEGEAVMSEVERTLSDKVAGVPSTSSAPLTSGEKDLLRSA